MAKKRQGDSKRRVGRSSSSSALDHQEYSDASSVTMDGNNSSVASDSSDDGHHTPADEWQDSLITAINDGMNEKTTAKRLRALETVCRLMSQHYTGDVLHNYVDTLYTKATQCFTRGAPQERALASQLLTLFITTFGPGAVDEDTYGTTCALLRSRLLEGQTHDQPGGSTSNVDSSESRDVDSRVMMVRALCMWMFAMDNAQDVARTGGSLDRVRDDLWRDSRAEVVAESINGWTLLASTLGVQSRNDIVLPRYKHTLLKLLRDSASMHVRVAAGQALALLYEAHNDVVNKLPANVREYDSHREPIIEQMEQYADEFGQQQSRKGRTSQKAAFRHFLTTLDECTGSDSGDAASEHITVNKNRVDFVGWCPVVQFNHFKNVLGHGITDHLHSNDFLRQVLDVQDVSFDAENVRKLSATEKKMYLSKSSVDNKRDTLQKNKLTRTRSQMMMATDDYE